MSKTRSYSVLRFSFLFFILLMVVGIFVARSGSLFWFFDGSWQLDMMRSQGIWGGGPGVWNYDPLRGLFNFYPNGDYSASPVVFLTHKFADAANLTVGIFVGYALLIFALYSLACISLRISFAIGILSTLVSLMFATPLMWRSPTLIFPIFILAPHFFECSIAFAFFVLTVALLASEIIPRVVTVLLAVSATAWALYFLLIMPQFSLLFLPPSVIAVVILASLSRSKSELLSKLALLVVIISSAAFSGLIEFSLNLAGTTSTAFFWQEMPVYDGGLSLSSMLYNVSRFPLGALLSLTSGVGSACIFWKCRAQLRSDVRIQLCAINAFLTVGMWLVFPVAWIFNAFVFKVPFIYSVRLIYFEYVFYLFTCFFGAYSVLLIFLLFFKIIALRRFTIEQVAYGVCVLVVGVILENFIQDAGLEGSNAYTYPPRPTAITSLLNLEIGVSPGETFRGRVATLSNDQGRLREFGWEDSILEDIQGIKLTGNDHKFDGLWYFDIPTLQEFSPFVSPSTYLLQTRFLAGPGTIHNTRNSIVLTRVNEMLLRLFGVRFLIAGTTSDLDDGIERARAGNRILYEIPDSNISGWAVGKVERVKDATEVLDKISIGSNLKEIAYVTDGDELKDLRPASTMMTLYPGFIRIRSETSGKSFVVLPFQFSRCFRIRGEREAGSLPKLLRTDLALTGILLGETSDFEIEMEINPFDRAHCLRDDAAELTAMKLIEAGRRFPLPSP